MFTLLTAASARGGAGASGGWAAASLALGTRLAVRRVGGRACTVRGGGAARGGDRLRASQPEPPAQRAFQRRLLAQPPACPGPLAGRRTDNSQLPGESLRGRGAGPSGDPAGAGRGWGCVGIARAASGSRGRGGGAGRAALEPDAPALVMGSGGSFTPGTGSGGAGHGNQETPRPRRWLQQVLGFRTRGTWVKSRLPPLGGCSLAARVIYRSRIG